MNPYAFELFGIGVKWYSLLILIGVVLAWLLLKHEASKFDIKNDFLLNLVFWTVIIGIIGARIYFCIFEWDYYSTHLNEIWQVWKGGLAIHGGLIAGLLVIIFYSRKYGVSPLKMLDMAVPYVLLAQAIGRWGNFFNEEVYGARTTYEHLKSLKFIPEFVINGMEIDGYFRIPLFYYESLFCLLGVIILLIIRRIKYIRVGQQLGAYMMWYGMIRFVFEGMRDNKYALMLGDIRVAQLVSLIIFVVGLIIIIVQIRKPKLEDLYNNKEKVEVVNF